jgi:DNA polymerase III alpha subunit
MLYNECCSQVLNGSPLNITINETRTLEEFHEEHCNTWSFPWEYSLLDVDKYVMSLCVTEEDRNRAAAELVLFRKYDLYNMIRFLKYFVDTMRKEGNVWGVGRGSSVSSYVLFLMKVHKVDSMHYELDYNEFFKEQK